MERTALYGRGIWNVKVWIGLGLIFILLNITENSEVASPYWFSEYILYGLMFAGLWANRRYDLRKKLSIPRPLAPAAYIFLVWSFGMMYEAGLTVTGEGISGIHRETVASFILAQGDYIPIAIVSYLVIRRLRLSFREVFFFAGGISLTEGLIFSGALTAAMVSPLFFLAPLVAGYYALAYSSFIALPLLFINEELLWQCPQPTAKHPIPFFWILGFVLGLPIRIFWGLVYSPVVTQLLRLLPNVSGS